MTLRSPNPNRVAHTALAVATMLAALPAQQPAAAPSFAHEVLPLLSDRCFRCHGPDERARRAGLRLDLQEHVFAERRDDAGRAYRIVVPGAPERSELWRRITAHGDDAMPPADANLTLDDDERATLRRWIEAGAEWAGHWAFEAPAAADELPDPDDAAGSIDALVRARLAERDLAPNPPAAPEALLRRVYLDLTGLPPSPAEVRAFVADPSDAAWLAVVDALLDSPHYGERMAWPWLEAARYADTDGYQNDPTRTAWPWRDWLVRTLNDNLPFDEFVVQCLAGDLLPDATSDQRLASAFLRHNAHNGEGGRIAEETRVENTFDRTETVGTVFLGLTFECARCHDHKYDPIPQRDYYRLFSFFDQSSETGALRSGGLLPPTMRYLVDDERRAELDRLRLQLAAFERELFAPDDRLDEAQRAWQQRERARLAADARERAAMVAGAWLRSAPFEGDAAALFDTRFAPECEAGENGFRPAPEFVDGQALALPQTVAATYFRRTFDAPSARRLELSFGSDDGIKVFWNGAEVLARDVQRGVRPDQERVEVEARAGSNTLLVKVVNTGGVGGAYFRLIGESASGVSAALANALLAEPDRRSDAERRDLLRRFRSERAPGFAARLQDRDALAARVRRLEAEGLVVSVMDELPPTQRRATPIYRRGDYQTPGEAVGIGGPEFLPPLVARGDGPPDRLDLARWLVSGEHPLTARVAVNRTWQTLFGRGLVATSEDFGRQGERPSHPRLLDGLARWFVRSGWDRKALVRAIVTSRTYRQSAHATAAAFADDPDNVWLARSARHRWPAWLLRDQALALSGRLVSRVGGEPVRPYQPDGVWAEATFDAIRYRRGDGDELYRRSLYTFWRRIVGPTVLFDTPGRGQCVVRHAETNTPLHALTTLNATDFVEAARGLAQRALAIDGSRDRRLAFVFEAATARGPEPAELAVLTRRLTADLRRYRSEPAAAAALLAVGEAAVHDGVDRGELAAWTSLALLVLNLDEVLTRP